MMSSSFCAVSAPLCLQKVIILTRQNANRCYSLRTTYLISEAFQILCPTASLTFPAAELFHQVTYERTKHKLRPFRIHNENCFETFNLLHVSICEMFTSCDVLHETKQKTQTSSRECAVRTGNHL